MTKLAIVQEREEDKYDHHTALRCWRCDPVNGKVITADDDTVCDFTLTLGPVFMRFFFFGRRDA